MGTDPDSDRLTDIEDEGEKTGKEDEEEVEKGEPETPGAARKTRSSPNKGPSQTASSPSPSRKRSREGEDIEMEDVEPPAPEQIRGPVVEEIVVRRKRLRA
jgi:hypothetical protein